MMNRMFGKFWQDIVLLVIAAALGVVLGLTLWGGAELKEVGHVRLVPDLLTNEIVVEPPLEKLPSSYDTVAIALALDFTPVQGNEYQNIFQTSTRDNGLRLKVSSACDVTLIVNSSRGPMVIVLPQCQFDSPFRLEMSVDEKGIFQGTANGKKIIGRRDLVNLIPRFNDVQYKHGFNGEKSFSGEIVEFDLRARFFKRADGLLLLRPMVVFVCLGALLCIAIYAMRKRLLVTKTPEPLPRVVRVLVSYWFVCSLGLIGILCGLSRYLQSSLLVRSYSENYNEWALNFLYPGKPQELIFEIGVWGGLFLYCLCLFLLMPKAGGLNSWRVEGVTGKRFVAASWGLLVGINALVFAWFRGRHNAVISAASLVVALLWSFIALAPLFCVLARNLDSLVFLSFIERTNQRAYACGLSFVHAWRNFTRWVQSRSAVAMVAGLLGLLCLHIVFIFSPFIWGDLKIANEYLDIPEYTYLDGALVSNTEYINSHQLEGLNKYDPMRDRGRTPAPRPGMYVPLPETSLLKSFIHSSDQSEALQERIRWAMSGDPYSTRESMLEALKDLSGDQDRATVYYYNDELQALVVNREMTFGEYRELASLYPKYEYGDKIAQLRRTSRMEHRRLMTRSYSSEEKSFLAKNQFELHNQIFNRWVIHHHNFVLGPINEYVKGRPLKDINAQYGPLNVVMMANLLQWVGGISYANYFPIWYSFWLIYFAVFVGCALLIFRDVFYATLACSLAFGYIITINFQILHLGPGLNPLRHFFDLPALAALCMFLRKGKTGFLLVALLCAFVGVLNNVQFGIALAVALGAVLIIMAMIDRELVSVRMVAVCGGSAAFLMVATMLLMSSSGSSKNSMLAYYLEGFVGPPIPFNRLFLTMMAVSAGYLSLVYFEKTARDLKYIVIFLLLYAQGLFLYYTWGGTPPHILNIAPILVLCVVGFLKVLLEGCWEGRLQRPIVVSLIVISLCVVYIPGSLAYYSTKQTFDQVFVDHKTYQWNFKTANFISTMDPQPFQDSIALINEFSGTDPAIYILSKYDNFIPFLAEKYSAMPFSDVPWFLVTTKEVNLCIEQIMGSQPPYLFIDTDIERNLNGEVMVGEYAAESRMRVQRLNLLKTIYSAIRGEYEPVKKGILLTAYKRKH